MRVLFLTNKVPFPPDSGYPIVVYNTIKGLTDAGAEVSVFSLNPQSSLVDVVKIDDPLFKRIKFAAATINTSPNRWETIKSIISRKSITISRFYKSGSVARLKNFLQHNEFDVVQLEGLFVIPYLKVIRQYSKARVIYRAHNLEHQIGGVMASSERSPLRRLYLHLLAKRLYRYELENLNKPDAVLAISNADKSELQYLGCEKRIETFPVALDLNNYVPDKSVEEYPSIFHIGAMDFMPTVESLEWFIRFVWNDLKNLDAGLKLHLAGRNMPGSFYMYQDMDTQINDRVENARDFINSKAIMIIPLQSGSGMRVKIIEAMAMKKCVISTSLGAEGINYEHGKNILIAETPDEFYRYILQCATDKKFCNSIGENARKLVERDYGIEHNTTRLISFYESLMSEI